MPTGIGRTCRCSIPAVARRDHRRHTILSRRCPTPPGDNLALTFGGSRSPNEITLDQVRRFAGAARVPMNPVWAIVRATVERTAEAWKALPAETRTVIEWQIQRVITGTKTS